ncbi:hypothetical protein D3C75_756210 [compost metagenome]
MLLQRHNPVYGRIRKSYRSIRFSTGGFIQLRIDQLFELCAAANCILAGDHMQRRI